MKRMGWKNNRHVYLFIAVIALLVVSSATIALAGLRDGNETKVGRQESSEGAGSESAGVLDSAAPRESSHLTQRSSGEKKNSSPSPKPVFSPISQGGVTISVTPSCVYRTQLVTVTLEWAPLSTVTYAAVFEDGRNHNLYGFGQANAEGSFVWTFAVPPDAAFGQAGVVASVQHEEKGAGGGMGVFAVREKGKCK